MDLLITAIFILMFLLYFCTGLCIGFFVGRYRLIKKEMQAPILPELPTMQAKHPDIPAVIEKITNAKRKPTGSAVMHYPDPEKIRKQKEQEAVKEIITEIEQYHEPKQGSMPYIK